MERVTVSTAELESLEASLWVAETRFDRAHMEWLLSPDFSEIGCSGRVWTREQILAIPAQPIPARLPFADFAIQPIAEGVVQVTYTSRVAYDVEQVCRRSSIWVATAEGWRLRFHQGTPVPG